MIKKPLKICILGNDINSLCLSYFMKKYNYDIKLILLNKKNNIINTYFYNGNIIENGLYYSFNLNEKCNSFISLLENLNLHNKILQSNKYCTNISYLNENGKSYKINKYLFRILYYIIKDYFFNKSTIIKKNNNFEHFILKYFDQKIYKDLIVPYCNHYLGFNPNIINMNSYFPELMKKINEKKSLIKLFSYYKKENSFSKNKNFTFKEGNIILIKKLLENLETCNNVNIINIKNNILIKFKNKKLKIYIGRNRLKFDQIIFCLNPLELKYFLKKNLKHKDKYILIKYLSKFLIYNVNITNVCFKNHLLPLSYSLDSLILLKENKNNKIISVLLDNNIYPNNQNEMKSQLFQTKFRFLSREINSYKSINEINNFMNTHFKIIEKPDLVISNIYSTFPYNEKYEKMFKKIAYKNYQNIRIFWLFSFFKNMDFCLNETKKFIKGFENLKKYDL